MAINEMQKRALDEAPDYEPAMRPRDGSAPVLLGTILTDVGDAAVATDSADGVVAAGANPTKAEYDVVVALVNDLKAKYNALVAKLAELANE